MAYTDNYQRASTRTQTKITGNVIWKTKSSNGVVVDLSDEGICFQFHSDIGLRAGDEVTIRSDELGFLNGTVRWASGNRIGIKLKLSSNTAAQIASYYRFFR
jgi:hypothetical protein